MISRSQSLVYPCGARMHRLAKMEVPSCRKVKKKP
jgi:hypothetical protein